MQKTIKLARVKRTKAFRDGKHRQGEEDETNLMSLEIESSQVIIYLQKLP